jgi:hypothetical protein
VDSLRRNLRLLVRLLLLVWIEMALGSRRESERWSMYGVGAGDSYLS